MGTQFAIQLSEGEKPEDVIAISATDHKGLGCPYCGSHSSRCHLSVSLSSIYMMMCNRCHRHYVVLPDGCKQSPVGGLSADAGEDPVAVYPCRRRHPQRRRFRRKAEAST